ncbi:AAA family ATPase [Wenzhouxiangella sp. XN201]|uniref:ExeA family protein n=1 Tax=Wenzhouxiangella sp. XN201 TaxID=2710755 RepID=UPI0013CDC129|nr:AAA family ATPase [Wenzhouxiangella sp. XN201]NEZ03972.1 AAA family ATPase [Wenzhouxiangella sp. XN201]
MYESFYGLSERPFSITPNPRFVYLSQRHRDALAHLLYGVGEGGSGGFVQLTGEVGTGKTTLCRVVLEQVPENTQIALILNPMLSPKELLRAICHELQVPVDDTDGSLQQLQERLNSYLLDRHARGERVVLIIDEAQNMSREALEQVRLLTNLETATDKLLQIILIGQPELRDLLARPELRQLAQRITARYHLDPLNAAETESYVRHRLQVAGSERCPFARDGLRALYLASEGVPRLVNIIADRALMAGYAREEERIGAGLVRAAAREVAGEESEKDGGWLRGLVAGFALLVVLAGGGALSWALLSAPKDEEAAGGLAWQAMLSGLDERSAWMELAAVWPVVTTDDVEQACSGEDHPILACRELRGNWAYIAELDLPVVLRLSHPAGTRVLLAGLERDHVILRHNGQDWRVARNQLDRRWQGEFVVAWPDDGQLLRQGDSGSMVRRMKRLAAEVDDFPWAGPVDERYSAEFRDWVAQFQRRHGINDDGVIGPATRLFLGVPRQDMPGLMTQTNGA